MKEITMKKAKFYVTAMRVRLKNLKPSKANLKANLKKGLWSFVISFASFGWLSEQVHLIKSATDSLPQHYFIQLPKLTPQKGDLTIFYNHWLQGKIIKRIIGVAGDQVHSDAKGYLWVNQQKVGWVYERTQIGNKSSESDGINDAAQVTAGTLTRIKDQVIPKGKVFLHSPHPQSFDSRYQEVGLVRVEDLEGKVFAIV